MAWKGIREPKSLATKIRRGVIAALFGNNPGLVRRLPAPLRDKVQWSLFKTRHETEDEINLQFDREHGTDTANEIFDLTTAGVSREQAARGNFYRATWESEFHEVMDALVALGIDLSKFSFVDYGSGKGKVLLMASLHPFRQVVGVEYSPAMHLVAVANCERFKDARQRCFSLTPVLADALEYQPPDGPVIAFIHNAFDPPTTRDLLLRCDALAKAREVVFIYVNLRDVSDMMPNLGGTDRLRPSLVRQRYAILR